MNKIVLIVSVIVAAVTCCTAQEPTLLGTEQLYFRSYAGFSGPVRTVLTVSQRPMGSLAKTFSTAAETFDPNGAITDSVYHYAEIEIHSGELASLDSSASHAYDSTGKLIRSVHYDPNGKITGRDEYRYDRGGHLTEVVSLRDGVTSDKHVFAYDTAKRQTTVTWVTYFGKPSTKYFVYTFDTKGRAIERTALNDDRSLIHRIVYSYDSNGNLAKEEHYDEKNQHGWGQIYTYKLDAKGNWYERENKYTQPDKEPSVDMVTYRVITYYGQDR